MRGHMHEISLIRLLIWRPLVMVGLETDDMIGIMNMGHGIVPVGECKHSDKRQNRK